MPMERVRRPSFAFCSMKTLNIFSALAFIPINTACDSQKALLWFRNDLRLDDHEVLAQLPESVYQLLCVFCIDPRDWES